MRYCLIHLFLSIKSNCEVSTLLLLRDVSLKLCTVDLFSNRPTTNSSSSFVFLSFPVYGLNPNDDSFSSQKLEEADGSSSTFHFEPHAGLGITAWEIY